MIVTEYMENGSLDTFLRVSKHSVPLERILIHTTHTTALRDEYTALVLVKSALQIWRGSPRKKNQTKK